VRGYLALNTLLFTHELGAMVRLLKEVERCKVDAIIVQDLGVCILAQSFAPHVEVHASTQMTVTSPQGVSVVKELGVKQVVLARELSIREMERFREVGVPLEVFVHGALCVAYSGQCLTSEALGRRSANRGECAQACRLPYRLWVDGELKDLGQRQYLLSPQDLAGIEYIPDLMRVGISSFKIEGRLKTAEYVAAITGAYRRAIDEAWKSGIGRVGSIASEAVKEKKVKSEVRYEMEMMFSRGLYSGWIKGVNHQELVHGLYSNKRGVYLGEVAEVRGDGLRLHACGVPLYKGDGVLFDTGAEQNDLLGGRIYELDGEWIGFERGVLKRAGVKVGHRLFKTDDPHLRAAIAKRFAKDKEWERVPLHFVWEGSVGRHARLVAWVDGCDEERVEVVSEMKIEQAHHRALDRGVVESKLGRLGDSCFVLGKLSWQMVGEGMLPLSELNRMRRKAVDALNKIRSAEEWLEWRWDQAARKKNNHGVNGLSKRTINVLNKLNEHGVDWMEARGSDGEVAGSVLCRTQDQAETALSLGWKRLYLDFEDIRRYRPVVDYLKATWGGQGEIYLATPRIQKATEQGFFGVIEGAKADGVLVRNLGALRYFSERKIAMVGDFSLNISNPWTARWLMSWGLEYVTASYDLTAEQIMDMADRLPGGSVEVTLHQYMPMFHMEHCVFAAFLSSGKDFRDCGRPCDRHALEIEDRVGMKHPVKADVGCRNTVFHGKAQSGAVYYERFRKTGIRRFRVELLTEGREEASNVLMAYDRMIKGNLSGEALIKEIGVMNRVGVTVGTFQDGEK
jgi:putative protease